MSAPNGPTLHARAKAELCALLARLFAHELDTPLYRHLESTGRTGLSWFEPEILALPEGEAVEALAVEYCRLFVGPQPLCPPYASAQRGEALLGGRPRTRLDAFLARHPVPPPDPAWRIASPDHIAVELAVLAHLYAAGAPAVVVREFLTQHLFPWAPAFLRQVESAARYQLYRTVARLAAAFLDEAEALSAQEEPLR